MAYYNYKFVRDQLPQWIIDRQGPNYEGDGNYDGDQWIATSEYIDFLENRLRMAGVSIKPTPENTEGLNLD